MIPLVVVETGPLGVEDAIAELAARGWRDTEVAVVTDTDSAAAAVLAALAERPLVVDVRAPREVADRVCDDLRRLVHFEHRLDAAAALTTDQHALLALLAEGTTLGAAATRLHLSRRSADRRLAAAKEALGVSGTGAAVAAYQQRLARLPLPPPYDE